MKYIIYKYRYKSQRILKINSDNDNSLEQKWIKTCIVYQKIQHGQCFNFFCN